MDKGIKRRRSAGGSAFGAIFHSFRYRNYRLFFGGQSVSLIGTWMQQIAMSWLVYRLTNSAFLLGVVAFCSQIPAFVLSPLTGVLADRLNKRRILLVTQTVAMAQAFLMAALTLAGVIQVWQVIILGVILGCVYSLDIPARHSFLIDMIERKEELGNAIALNSSMFNLARLLGPSLAGILIAYSSEGVCFLLNGVSFLFVIVSLLAMKVTRSRPAARNSNLLHDLREGLVYTFGFAPIRSILMLLSVSSLMGLSYVVLMPIVAKDVLHGGPQTLGFLMAASGTGALLATVYLASRKEMLRLGKMLPLATAFFGAGLIAFSFSRVLWISLPLLFVAGFWMMVQMALSNTVLQVIVEDDKRGRVMSFYMMSLMGMAPLGSLLSGFLASRIGVPNTLMIGGIACAMAALIFALHIKALQRMLHPVYRKMGIVPEVASGIQAAVELATPPED
ncbi:MAG: MFS transporter [bacterium]